MNEQKVTATAEAVNAATARSVQAGNAIIAAAQRRSVPAGLTFGDFIAAARSLGVTDADPLDSIEFGVSRLGNGCITVDREDGQVCIGEVI